MLKVMFRKLRSNILMTLCLLSGLVLLMATASGYPMYKNSALNRMLRDEFKSTYSKTGKWPAYVKYNVVAALHSDPSEIFKAEEAAENLYSDMGVTKKETVKFFVLGPSGVSSELSRREVTDVQARAGFYSNISDHISILAGEGYSESGVTSEGEIEVLISADTMVKMKLLVGEVLKSKLLDASGNNIRFKVVGVFAPSDESDCYWQMVSASAASQLLMKEEVFKTAFLERDEMPYNCTAIFNEVFEYKDLNAGNIDKVLSATEYMKNEGEYAKSFNAPYYLQIIEDYQIKKLRTEATLVMLTVPVLFLLFAFMFMVSEKLYDVESNEISVMKSRGSSSWQIFRIYLYQNVFLTLLGTALGLPLGVFFAKVLGATRSFLDFSDRRVLHVYITDEVIMIVLAAALISIIVMTVPAISRSKVSIVNLKQKKALKKHSWWEKCFLDVIFLGIAGYGYYESFSSNAVVRNVVLGRMLDPVVYISSSCMIIGLGLLAIRLKPYFIKLLYVIGKSKWSPANYISFKENAMNGRKEQFIMLFLIMSVGFAMLNALMARTILANSETDAEYRAAADIIMKEVWKDNSYLMEDEGAEFTYYEPDPERFGNLSFVDGFAKVINDNATVKGDKNRNLNVSLLGINTKAFGEVTDLKDGLNEKSYREYLNELAVSEKGCIVSSSFRDNLGLSVGDNINFTGSNGKTMYLTILDFVDFWPGFVPSASYPDREGNLYTVPNYLIVTHYGLLREKWGLMPYEVWMKLKDGYTADSFYAWVNSENIRLSSYKVMEEEVENVITDPILQGTNGILTMGFLVTMLLVSAGYVIYWVISIKSRELMFGVLRAEGMHKGEILRVLINEQVFSGGFALIIGMVIGHFTSKLFVPVLQSAYLANSAVLPLMIVSDINDLIKLYSVILVVVFALVFILSGMVRRLNISKALKLGEE